MTLRAGRMELNVLHGLHGQGPKEPDPLGHRRVDQIGQLGGWLRKHMVCLGVRTAAAGVFQTLGGEPTLSEKVSTSL